jgi:cell wall assembly regulator SMI1
MQKFTRSLTREIEIAGERLGVTFSEAGVSIRPVGSRKPPHELSWEACVCACTNRSGKAPTAEDVRAALNVLRAGGERSAAAEPATKPAPAPSAQSSSGASLRELLGRVDSWMHAHRPRYQEGLQPGASTADLQALQTALGLPLPEDLRTWLEWHNGQSAEVFGALEEDWHPMTTSEIAEAKRALDGEGHPGWQRGWIPFLDDDKGDYLCLDPQQDGAWVRECWRGHPEHPVVAPSLAAWVQRFLQGLEHGAYTEDPERGGLHRAAAAAPQA